MFINQVAKTFWEEFVSSGTEKSFQQFYEYYYPYLRLIGAKKAFQTEIVKEAIDEVFIYCWEKRKKLESVTDIHNYIITAFLRKLYKSKNQKLTFFNLDDFLTDNNISDLQLPSPEYNVVMRENESEISQILKKQLLALPSRQREMIYQKYFLGLSYSEIAEVNGLSVNTVYNTIYTSISKLKNVLPKNTLLNIAVSISIFFLLFFL